MTPSDVVSTPPVGRAAALGFGSANIGNLGSAVDAGEAASTIDRAWERGIRYFDTAPHYGLGLAERRLGSALARRSRGDYVVSTKVGRRLVRRATPLARDDEGFDVPGDAARVWDFSPDGVRTSLLRSCDRLGVDRVEIALVHDPDQAHPAAAASGLRALTALKEEGLVDRIGIGTNATAGLVELIRTGHLDVLMLAGRFTLLDHESALPVLAAARSCGVDVIAAGVFNSGLLASPRPAADATFDYLPAPESMVRRAHAFADVCQAHDVDLPTVALGFVTRHPAISTVVLGMRSAREVDENVDRCATEVPTGVWDDLVAAGLLPAWAAARA